MSEENVTEQEAVQPADTTVQDSSRSDKDKNFERLRNKLESLESEAHESREVIKKQNELLERMQTAFSSSPQDSDDYERMDAEDFISKKHLNKWEQRSQEKFKQLAEKAIQEYEKKNYIQKLHHAYPDYEDVVSTENVKKLEQDDPEYAQLLAEVKDDYKRREMAYKRIKKAQKNSITAQQVVEENKAKNYYYSPAGQGSSYNSHAIEFDVRNKSARQQAYERLKSAQKRGF